MRKNISVFNNVLGAFADGAILFPLMALLTLKAGFSSSIILFTTGIAYLISSMIFRVPMSVQPLKSIAVVAVTFGATFSEIRISGLILGLFCVSLMFFNVDRIAKRVPIQVIHQLQLGLGILLIFQGLNGGIDLVILTISLFVVFFPSLAGIPILGLLATAGLLIAVFSAQPLPAPESSESIFAWDTNFRIGMVASLLLPQLALTMTNSVLATRDVCVRSFGKSAERVTIQNLLSSIGIGNICMAVVGGMPFCHGSGGVTAHVRGGSTKAWSTGLMGFVLLILSAIQFHQGSSTLAYPASLAAILLVATGIFHLQLAKPTISTIQGRVKLFVAAVLTILTRNLLIVLGGAIALEFIFSFQNSEGQVNDQLS